MSISYRFEPIMDRKEWEKEGQITRLNELERQISKSIPFLEKNLDRLLEYIKKEDSLKNYIEISLPFFDSNISYKFNLYSGKWIISVMSFEDSVIYGHLLIDGYDCLDKKGIKDLGLKVKIPSKKNHFRAID